MSDIQKNTRMWCITCALLLFMIIFTALGFWQIQRRAWKMDLINRVTHRVAAPVVPAPATELWPQINVTNDEYRHVRVTGRFLVGLDTQVKAVTHIGSGFWLLTPLMTNDGTVVLINRGFIPPQSTPWVPPDGSVTITGLLRLTEPGGGFLRHNDPANDRWFSRDVAAVAEARGLIRTAPVAPYFVDVDASPVGDKLLSGQPVGGLTVIAFANSHLVYALTWFALALMVAGAAIALVLQNAKHHDSNRSASGQD
jgi:surfeit locus 1 family protein